jgi:guanylate kinase
MLKFDKPTLVTITAPTCSGKNFLRDTIEQEFSWGRIVSTTTRPARAGEVDGADYDFISMEKSIALEAAGCFAELVEFRGVRYGVTHDQMERAMSDRAPSMVILEPRGLELYKKMCVEKDWDIFTIYVHTVESLRLERLLHRTINDYNSCPFRETKEKIIKTHIDRTISITGEERAWSNATLWNAIVPGDDIDKAIKMIELGIENRNHRNKEPAAFAL